MEWWGYVIIVGVIFIIAVLILIWIIVASNRIVVLKKKVDRNYPLVNSKIKEYNKAVDELLKYIKKSLKTNDKSYLSLKKANDELSTADGIFKKVEKQSEVNEKFEKFLKFCKKQEKLKDNKTFEAKVNSVLEVQENIKNIEQKYNKAVDDYNKAVVSFPTNIIAERFKFETAKHFIINNVKV